MVLGLDGKGQQELATVYGKFIVGEKPAQKEIIDYYTIYRYSEPKVNDFLENTIAKSCRDNMLSKLVNEPSVTVNATLLSRVLVTVERVRSLIELTLEQVEELYYRFPNPNPLEQTELQDSVQKIARILFKSDKDKAELGRIFTEKRLKDHGVIIYPFQAVDNQHIVWGPSQELYEQVKTSALKVKLLQIKGRNLVAKDSNGLSDPFLEVDHDEKKVQFKTSIKHKTLNPDWEMSQEKHDTITCAPFSNKLTTFTMYDDDLLKKEFMGAFQFCSARIYALQEKGLDHPLESVTVVLQPEKWEKRAILKDKYDYTVSGYIAVTMKITKE